MTSKTNLNRVIFDDEENNENTNQMLKHSQAHNRLSHQKDKSEIILKEISELQLKINSIEKESQKLRKIISHKNDNPNNNINNNNFNNSSSATHNTIKQIQQVLILIQKKIQVILKETKVMYDKVQKNFQKKLASVKQIASQTKTMMKGKQQHQVNHQKVVNEQQIKSEYEAKVQQCKKYFQRQLDRLVNDSKAKQNKMAEQLSQIEQRYMNKMNQFESKQQEYVRWIHHLQAKLRDRKSKKAITITQDKPQMLPNKQLKLTQNINLNQISQMNNSNMQNVPFQNGNSRNTCSIDQRDLSGINSSKITRKHKIFGGKVNRQKQSSVSPIARQQSSVTPTKDSLQTPADNQRCYNSVQPSLNQVASSANLYQYQNQQNQQNLIASSSTKNLGFYNELVKNKNPPSPHSPHTSTQNQFYRDIPVPNSGWDNFADMNDDNQQYTDSQSDDFFAPISNNNSNVSNDFDSGKKNRNYQQYNDIPIQSRERQPQRNTDRNNKFEGGYLMGMTSTVTEDEEGGHSNDKVFSPFDLN